MRVKCRSKDGAKGAPLEYTVDINNMEDYVRVRASMVRSAYAFIGDIQIVKDGFITNEAYNDPIGIVSRILENNIYEDKDEDKDKDKSNSKGEE